MSGLDESEVEDVKEVFELFDFWDGRDGLVDAVKMGDFLRCCGLNPTNGKVGLNGGTDKEGDKQYTFDQIIPLYATCAKDHDTGTFADFMEAFKTFDREGQGFISSLELKHVITNLGEKLTEEEVANIIKWTGLVEDLDGNVKYEDFINKVLAGPAAKK